MIPRFGLGHALLIEVLFYVQLIKPINFLSSQYGPHSLVIHFVQPNMRISLFCVMNKNYDITLSYALANSHPFLYLSI